MGTNYYIKEPAPCPCCGQLDPNAKRHIGKSSAGWAFALRVYPDEGINTLDDWVKVFEEGGQITNEYGHILTSTEMLSRITRRPGAERRSIGRHCIGHGSGPWDYIGGEFS